MFSGLPAIFRVVLRREATVGGIRAAPRQQRRPRFSVSDATANTVLANLPGSLHFDSDYATIARLIPAAVPAAGRSR